MMKRSLGHKIFVVAIFGIFGINICCSFVQVYFDVFLTEDSSKRANQIFEISSVITKADNLTFGSAYLESNQLHWNLKYYHKTTYPCAESVGKDFLNQSQIS
jgi:hypothetical protein